MKCQHSFAPPASSALHALHFCRAFLQVIFSEVNLAGARRRRDFFGRLFFADRDQPNGAGLARMRGAEPRDGFARVFKPVGGRTIRCGGHEHCEFGVHCAGVAGGVL